jgi:hypothetical protein
MLWVGFDGVHLNGAREAQQLARRQGGHVPRRAGADPDDGVLEQ